jgi:uncharacterized protein YbgA (DUF1722 family)/uncharacterized protein YbbK (DUF523 family)
MAQAPSPASVAATIRVGISSCLLGQEVRFDGGHKHDSYITGTLGQYFEFVPVCPEMAVGLGKPREPIRLEGDPQRPRAVGTRSKDLDVTDALDAYGRRMGSELAGISGYLFKRASPSCGMERVKVYAKGGMPSKQGVGIYARAFMETQPLLPVEEEGRLGDPVLRENFIQRVFVYHRWQQLAAGGLTAAGLVEFHTRHKLIVMAHNQAAYRRLGQLVAGAGRGAVDSLSGEYVEGLMQTLAKRASRKGHANVLSHLMGYLKRSIDGADKAELVETIDAYRRGLVPLVVPVTLLRHHFRRHPHPYVEGQYYLEPHPPELMLRNVL